jgi:predicted AlkP superfamily phosphohydrolase/phosphomutase
MKHRTSLLPSLAFLALALLATLPAAGQASPKPSKIVVLGFDGADAKLAERFMNEGHLPSLAKLRAEGTFSPLRSTIPSQTPVSWSTFSTGLSPGRHAIFDFLKRDPKTYRPGFAAFDQITEPFLFGANNKLVFGAAAAVLLALLAGLAARLVGARGKVLAAVTILFALAAGVGGGYVADTKLPKSRPQALNRQQGETVWELMGKAGKKVEVFRMPVTFPPEPFEHGELFAGLGVPDLSGTIGKPYYFTSELFFTPKAGNEFSLQLVELIDNQGEIPTEIAGPPDHLFQEGRKKITIPLTLTVAPDKSSLRIQASGNDFSMKPGEWTDWKELVFPFNSLIKVQGIGRFYLISLEPEVRLYLSPLQFDPEKLPPSFEITTPPEWIDELTHEHGRFKTMGWAIDTWSISEGTIDEDAFLQDVEFTVAKEEEMLQGFLAKADWDVLIHYFEFTDRVQHILWRYFDTGHPMYDPAKGAKYGPKILEAYQRLDKIVGDTRAKLPADAALVVVSDHGFASFRWGMNYNTWLVENGYMVLTGQDPQGKNLDDLFGQGEFFQNVDWAKTKAYSLGLGQMYINLKGREGEGIVTPGEEYRALTAELKAKLEGFVDPATGLHPVAHVFTRDEAYGTYDAELIPDLIVSNGEYYRVGWQDSLGAISGKTIEVNDRAWSGDHCSVYPPLVDGILFSSVRLPGPEPKMADMMPTLLELAGVPVPEGLDGKSLAGR